jgi:hypothetical protein
VRIGGLASPPRGRPQDCGEQSGDLAGSGLVPAGFAPAARLVAEPIRTLAAGPAAVRPAPTGARPAQLSAAQDAARCDVTKRARFVARQSAHAICSPVWGIARAAMTRSMTAQAIVRHEVSPGKRPIAWVRLRTSSSDRSSRLVERRRLRSRGIAKVDRQRGEIVGETRCGFQGFWPPCFTRNGQPASPGAKRADFAPIRSVVSLQSDQSFRRFPIIRP